MPRLAAALSAGLVLAVGTASEADARGVRPIGATWALTTERLSNERDAKIAKARGT